jgi:hypothetical protein
MVTLSCKMNREDPMRPRKKRIHKISLNMGHPKISGCVGCSGNGRRGGHGRGGCGKGASAILLCYWASALKCWLTRWSKMQTGWPLVSQFTQLYSSSSSQKIVLKQSNNNQYKTVVLIAEQCQDDQIGNAAYYDCCITRVEVACQARVATTLQNC